jgi:hypothetical protein
MTTQLLPKETIAEWGLQSLPEEKQVEMIDRIGRLIYQAVLVRSLDLLSDNEQDELDEMLNHDTTGPQEVLVFLAQKIPTFEQMRLEEVAKLKDEVLVSV